MSGARHHRACRGELPGTPRRRPARQREPTTPGTAATPTVLATTAHQTTIELTVTEIRRARERALIEPARDLSHRLYWSGWRRQHQFRAEASPRHPPTQPRTPARKKTTHGQRDRALQQANAGNDEAIRSRAAREGISWEEYQRALADAHKTKWDVIKEVAWEVLKEISGWNDIVDCFSKGDIWACGGLVAGLA